MSSRGLVLFSCCLLLFTACKSNDTATSSVSPPTSSPTVSSTPPLAQNSASPLAAKSRLDVCTLLTDAEVKSVQGEEPKEHQRSDRQNGSLLISQCYYSLPTLSNSVVLNVTTGTDGGDVRGAWKNTFPGKEEQEREGKEKSERRKKPDTGAREGEAEGEEAAKPEKVIGLGDDAYWIASRVGGALYVLKKDLFFRISVGGAGDANAKLKKSKTLAQLVLKRV